MTTDTDTGWPVAGLHLLALWGAEHGGEHGDVAELHLGDRAVGFVPPGGLDPADGRGGGAFPVGLLGVGDRFPLVVDVADGGVPVAAEGDDVVAGRVGDARADDVLACASGTDHDTALPSVAAASLVGPLAADDVAETQPGVGVGACELIELLARDLDRLQAERHQQAVGRFWFQQGVAARARGEECDPPPLPLEENTNDWLDGYRAADADLGWEDSHG